MSLGLEPFLERFDDVRMGGGFCTGVRNGSAYPSHVLLAAAHFKHAGFCSSHLTRRTLTQSECHVSQLIEAKTKDLLIMTDLQVKHPLLTLDPLFLVSFRGGFSMTSVINISHVYCLQNGEKRI